MADKVDPRAEHIQQLQDSIKTNERVIRVLKKGFYPASVGADVQNSLNYFGRLNEMWRGQIKQLRTALPNKEEMVAEPIPAPEVKDAPEALENA